MITGRLRNSHRLAPFLILLAGTFLPVAALVLDCISFLPYSFRQYLFTLSLVSVLLGWLVRYSFILYDVVTRDIRIGSFIVYNVIFVVAIVLALVIGESQHSQNLHMADEEYSLENAFINVVILLNLFPLAVFFSRRTDVKKESLCLAITIALCLLVSLPVLIWFV